MVKGKCRDCREPLIYGWDIHAEAYCVNPNCPNPPPPEDKNWTPPKWHGNPIPGYIGGDEE